MAKKLSAQTVSATTKTLKKAAPALTSEEERAIRMRAGVGLQTSEKLARKTTDAAVAEKIAQIELAAFKAMGQKIYGLKLAAPATRSSPGTLAARSSKDKIIKALKRK